MARELSAAEFADAKPHYEILDGLRGVAALLVVWFHIFEAHATSHLDQGINHGYLAVDFFFILSGFVIGYAYDDRWRKMGVWEFFKRRLIRLHPMVVLSALLGAAMFYTQGCEVMQVGNIAIGVLLMAMVMNMLLIPLSPAGDIRGFNEMYPLNGPSWSLLYEYLGNILYAFVLRFLPTKILAVVVGLAAVGLTWFAMFGELGDLCAGYAMTEMDMTGGSLRLLFSFGAGLLMARLFKPIKVKGAFWIGAVVFVILSALPRLGGESHFWINGLYDSLCVVVVFPLLVWLGASGKTSDLLSSKLCKFLGDISFPLYMVHYPLVYLYYAWVRNHPANFVESLPEALALFFGSIALAWLCLKFYDIPVRRFLISRMARK